jgi:hypothetical protein
MDPATHLTTPPLPLTRSQLVALERASLRAFVTRHRHEFRGRVLDYGCGLPSTCAAPEPYRAIVEGQGATYVPYDVAGYDAPVGPFDAILCTQVIQLVEAPVACLRRLRELTRSKGVLLITFPTAWEERATMVDDDHRFTARGMARALGHADWVLLTTERRWQIPGVDFTIAGGYGMIARAT